MHESSYQRLSRLDETFLAFETPHTYMHVAMTAILDPGSLLTEEGGIHLARIRQHVASRLHRIPRYRQRLAYTPIVNDAVWVDDPGFRLSNHVRHTSLPRPGGDKQLRRRTTEILERPLDRSRPLWEMWVIEGLAEGRFALVFKVHHCMVDGVGGVNLMAQLFGVEAKPQADLPRAWEPRPGPAGSELLRNELLRRGRKLLQTRRDLRGVLREPLQSGRRAGARLAGLWSLARSGFESSTAPCFNGAVGPHRRISWQSLPLEDIKAVSSACGGTVNDVILATVSGALHRYLARQPAGRPSAAIKVAVPVNIRREEERGELGNRSSTWLLPLPVHIPHPRHRLERITQLTRRLKQEGQSYAAELLTRAAEWTSANVLHAGVRLLAASSPYHLIVTNVPGPPVPLYLLDAPILAAYPHLPLFERQGLGIALFSYAGNVFWGLTGDWDLMADLDDFGEDIRHAFQELQGLVQEPEPGRSLEPSPP